MYLVAVLFYYYAQIGAGDLSPTTLRDYAVVESLKAGVDPQLVLAVIQNESRFDYDAYNDNDGKHGCHSRGLVQIRSCDHPEVTDEMANDPIFAVQFFIKHIDKCTTWWKGTCPLTKKNKTLGVAP